MHWKVQSQFFFILFHIVSIFSLLFFRARLSTCWPRWWLRTCTLFSPRQTRRRVRWAGPRRPRPHPEHRASWSCPRTNRQPRPQPWPQTPSNQGTFRQTLHQVYSHSFHNETWDTTNMRLFLTSTKYVNLVLVIFKTFWQNTELTEQNHFFFCISFQKNEWILQFNDISLLCER